MMTNFFILTLVASSLSKNPMKMCMMTLMSTAGLIWMMTIQIGKSFFPMIMFMLFMGGILLMFMILSSTMPNKESKKLKMKSSVTTFSMIMIFMTLNQISSKILTESEQLQQMFMFVNNTLNMGLCTSIMMIYFSMFINMIKSNKNTMRSVK